MANKLDARFFKPEASNDEVTLYRPDRRLGTLVLCTNKGPKKGACLFALQMMCNDSKKVGTMSACIDPKADTQKAQFLVSIPGHPFAFVLTNLSRKAKLQVDLLKCKPDGTVASVYPVNEGNYLTPLRSIVVDADQSAKKQMVAELNTPASTFAADAKQFAATTGPKAGTFDGAYWTVRIGLDSATDATEKARWNDAKETEWLPVADYIPLARAEPTINPFRLDHTQYRDAGQSSWASFNRQTFGASFGFGGGQSSNPGGGATFGSATAATFGSDTKGGMSTRSLGGGGAASFSWGHDSREVDAGESAAAAVATTSVAPPFDASGHPLSEDQKQQWVLQQNQLRAQQLQSAPRYQGIVQDARMMKVTSGQAVNQNFTTIEAEIVPITIRPLVFTLSYHAKLVLLPAPVGVNDVRTKMWFDAFANNIMHTVDPTAVFPEDNCVICLETGPECTLLPCRHKCVHLACAGDAQLGERKTNTFRCPLCRTPVQSYHVDAPYVMKILPVTPLTPAQKAVKKQSVEVWTAYFEMKKQIVGMLTQLEVEKKKAAEACRMYYGMRSLLREHTTHLTAAMVHAPFPAKCTRGHTMTLEYEFNTLPGAVGSYGTNTYTCDKCMKTMSVKTTGPGYHCSECPAPFYDLCVNCAPSV